jgi:hypothetical protein
VNSYKHSEALQHIWIEAQNHSALTIEARELEKGDMFKFINVWPVFDVGVTWPVVVKHAPLFTSMSSLHAPFIFGNCFISW